MSAAPAGDVTADELCPACGRLVELHDGNEVRQSCPKTWPPGQVKRGGRAPRPKAEPQSDALFDEPEHQLRTFVPLAHTPADALFIEPGRQDRKLVQVDGWPNFTASSGAHRTSSPTVGEERKEIQ